MRSGISPDIHILRFLIEQIPARVAASDVAGPAAIPVLPYRGMDLLEMYFATVVGLPRNTDTPD